MKIEQKETGREKPLWEGHRERLRRRMERDGWDALKPYEMVELALYHAVPRQDLSDVARLLVDCFGGAGGVFAASRAQLLAVPGVTPALAEWIELTGELMRAYCDLRDGEDIRLRCCQDVMAFLAPRMDLLESAELWVLYADFCFNLITFTDISDGATWWDAANARRLLVEAIGNGARYVYLVLRREAASAGMTDAEAERLNAIAATLRAADLDLVDCLLVDGRHIFSMNVHGRMERIRAESGCLALHERYGANQDSPD